MKTFFIAGAQRSGTTLLAAMLSKHKDIHIDLDTVIYRVITCFGSYKDVLPENLDYSRTEIQEWLINNDYKGRLLKLIDKINLTSNASSRQSIQKGIEDRLTKNNKKVFGDKAPEIENFLPELLMLIPAAKIIHIVRDGRAVALSKHERSHKNLLLGAQEWVESTILGLSHQAMLGERHYKMIKYEELLIDPEQTLKELCQFLEIDYDPKMITDIASQEADSYVKPTLDISKINSFKTKLTEKQIKRIEKIQAPLLTKLGYELEYLTAEKKHKQMSVAKRLFLSQSDNFMQLFVSKRKGMVSGKNIEVKIPLKKRLGTFVFMLGYDLLSKRIFKRTFRKRWVKNTYLTD